MTTRYCDSSKGIATLDLRHCRSSAARIRDIKPEVEESKVFINPITVRDTAEYRRTIMINGNIHFHAA
jgi:hypothetical protein